MTALTAAPLALALVLAGCAGGADNSMPGMDGGTMPPSSSATAQDGFNAADSMFAMMMIPHHEQAVEMSDMILAKDGIDDSVQDLARQIKAAQGPEIELMQSWLDGSGMSASDGMDGMGDGMMSGDDMATLEAASGAEASRLYLEQMIVHHEGALEMAQAELQNGSSPDALELAQTIVDAQTSEIALMQELLTSL
ncbi:DUF305 domain-containing protein [Microbacterium oleivorans]|uniref:DUF305 domain-containing protein n=1 Tax=Microbacterium TaxID=33882 RepID=UPI0033FBBC4F